MHFVHSDAQKTRARLKGVMSIKMIDIEQAKKLVLLEIEKEPQFDCALQESETIERE